ncbi:TonB-dependent receptor plug domain-containing protein [Sphingobacterium sp. E70]|uniref:TonB-dependent receptor plug domain-containing protein n=1 Tax=Sphingobacterium sp. E70 TaxID=2853439 RepID=UPI00211C974B|nr:TonB-dependent receptor plug domain-containing protein [Sphingobacterium sp. E70]ULT23465.1 TonB-dependent receptor plug domain-containing protein [Sphingobacterium sp. E70]
MIKIILPLSMLLFGMNCVVAQSETKISVDSTQNGFTLGEVTIYGNKNSPIFNAVRSDQFQSFAKNDVAKALNLLPGISQSQIGPRNETMLYIRGFDLRSVPVLIDGIPVYVPYDGYVDLGRFLTFDLAEVQIAKGYTSVNYGPNAMGGAINLITKKPIKPFEVNGATGWQSGGYRSNFNIGSNLGKFYVQTGISKYKRNYIPLSKDFVSVANEDGGHRDNSYTDDEKISLKVAYKPTDNSEYALSYAYQHGSKGSPVYAGQDTRNSLLVNRAIGNGQNGINKVYIFSQIPPLTQRNISEAGFIMINLSISSIHMMMRLIQRSANLMRLLVSIMILRLVGS